VLIGVVREMLEKTPAPRNAFVPFRLGQIFGEPGADVQQRAVLMDALMAFTHVSAPGTIVDLPYRWKRSGYRDPLALT
jgi:hypothetical protein